MASTSGYGLVITGDDQASSLYSSNRDYNNRLTWQDLYNSNSLAGANAVSQLQQSYTDATTQAYISYLQNKNALASSGVVGSGKASAMQAYDSSLQSTMSSYASSLSEGVTSITDAVSENASSIAEALQTQGDYTAGYTNMHYSYMEQLYEDYLNGENTLFDSPEWSQYLTTDPILDEDGNEQYNEDGTLIGDTRLKTWSELVKPTYDEVTDENGNITKEYSSLFDENGNLTSKGTDFFDLTENSNANTALGTSFGEYLYNTNEDLYNWANSYNYYNYTQAGTNAGTVKTMYGMMSTDNSYSYAERLGGMTSSQLEETFSDFTKAYSEMGSGASGIQEGITDVLTSAQSLLTELGLIDDIENETGMSITDYINKVSSVDLFTSGEFAGYVAGGTTAIVLGAVAAIVGVALIGTGVGAGAGLAAITGGVTAIGAGAAGINTATTNLDNSNAQLGEIKQIYDQFVVNLTDYIQRKKQSTNKVSVIY